jgi:hypothetical protein
VLLPPPPPQELNTSAPDQACAEEAAADKAPVSICDFFHRGKCTFGDACLKSHDPLPLYKKDLRNVALRSAAEAAAEKKAAEAATKAASSSNGGAAGVKVKTEMVKIVKDRGVRPAQPVRSSATNGTTFTRAGVSFSELLDTGNGYRYLISRRKVSSSSKVLKPQIRSSAVLRAAS